MADAPSHGRTKSGLEATYKGREVEGLLDLLFYRPVGYQLALQAQRLSLSPAAVTILGGVIGILAGHLYYYADLRLNAFGMFLHVLSNAFDNADGQLARLTGRGSRVGRALDGLVDNLVFASIYLHLCLRYIASGGTSAVWLLVLAAAASHSVQSASADYLRNAYLYFTGARSELESSATINSSLRPANRSQAWWEEVLLTLYLSYTRQQELLAPGVSRLRAIVPGPIPQAIATHYQRKVLPLLRTAGVLTTNSRMLILFTLLGLAAPVWYLVIEVTVLNLVLATVLLRQHAIIRHLTDGGL